MIDRDGTRRIALSLLAFALAGCATTPQSTEPRGPTLGAFESDEALVAYHGALLESLAEDFPPDEGDDEPRPPQPFRPIMADPPTGELVARHGDHLIVLERSRLYTVRVGGGALEPVASVDAWGPHPPAGYVAYSGFVVSGDLIAVTGHGWETRGIEIVLFRIDGAGRLTHVASHHLRSRQPLGRAPVTFARGGKLVFLGFIPFDGSETEPVTRLYGHRRLGTADTTPRRTTRPSSVHYPALPLIPDDSPDLHAITVCGVAAPELECRTTALFAPYPDALHVSDRAVYLWTTHGSTGEATDSTVRKADPAAVSDSSAADVVDEDGSEEERPLAREPVIYRLPLDGSAPAALRVPPVTRPEAEITMAEADGHLNAVIGNRTGQYAWEVQLLRVPLTRFGDGARAVDARHLRSLPAIGSGGLERRFVGDWLLYGVTNGWGMKHPDGAALIAAPLAGRDTAVRLPLPHGVDAIEAMGTDAVVLANEWQEMHFSAVRLGRRAGITHHLTGPVLSQAETNGYGFQSRADGPEAGLLAVPTRGRPMAADPERDRGPAAVRFLRREGGRLAEAGQLSASPTPTACAFPCRDTHANTRALFIDGRIFALLGDEIVEGTLDGGRVRELRRIHLAR